MERRRTPLQRVRRQSGEGDEAASEVEDDKPLFGTDISVEALGRAATVLRRSLGYTPDPTLSTLKALA